jgi:hypothetical protein
VPGHPICGIAPVLARSEPIQIGTGAFLRRFSRMTNTELLDQSFIAWSVLERSGELGDPESTAQFLFGKINSMMVH